MARGFLGGVVWGGIVVLGFGAVVSVLAPLPQPPEVGAAPGARETPSAAIEPAQVENNRADEPAPQTGQSATPATAPAPDDLSVLDETTTAAAAQPETGSVAGIDTPEVVANAQNSLPEAEVPVLPNPQALAPMAPEAVAELSISTEPAQPPAPPVEAIESAFDLPVQPDVGMINAPVLTAPQNTEESAPILAKTQAGAVAEAAPKRRETLPQRQAEAELAPGAAPAPLPSDAQAAQSDGDEPAPAAQAARPSVGTPANILSERDTGVIINRLPNVASQKDADPDAEPQDNAIEASPGDPRAIIRNAMPFTLEEDKPLMAIVLIDNGKSLTGGEAGLAALRSFPYPVSFAVDASLPDAASRMRAFREEGFEVLAMVDLPEGATPSDAETSFAVALNRLPEVVAVLEGTHAGLQISRDVSDQVAAILAQSGHGLVTQDKGLNTMPKLARKDGVPAAPVFRDFDSKEQTPTVIRRFLDQAAFKAGQEGGVIMLGRLRPDTISALLLWGLQDRASKVTLAPVSAVLMQR